MSGWPDPSVGEIGGAFAGLVALLACIGKGFAWLLGWQYKREESRGAKLDAWQRELNAREDRFDDQQRQHWAEIARELEQSKAERTAEAREWQTQRAADAEQWRRERTALLGGYQLIASELRAIKPESDALKRADELLHSAYLLDPLAPLDMMELLKRARRSGEPPLD